MRPIGDGRVRPDGLTGVYDMLTAVVCDDDRVLRQTISDLCESAGLQVVAETDSAPDAVALVRRFGVDVLVLDLSLGDASGETALESLRDVQPHPTIVVFTAYAAQPADLLRMGAYEVIEKPGLQRLAATLERIAAPGGHAEGDAAALQEERRSTSRAVESLVQLWRSPSGISSAVDLARTLDSAVDGDAILLLAVRGLDELDERVGPVLLADCRLAPARLLRQTLRTQDLVHEVPVIDGFAAVLRGGDARAAAAAWARLLEMVETAHLPGELRGVCAPIGVSGARDALARAIAVLQAAPPVGTTLVSA